MMTNTHGHATGAVVISILGAVTLPGCDFEYIPAPRTVARLEAEYNRHVNRESCYLLLPENSGNWDGRRLYNECMRGESLTPLDGSYPSAYRGTDTNDRWVLRCSNGRPYIDRMVCKDIPDNAGQLTRQCVSIDWCPNSPAAIPFLAAAFSSAAVFPFDSASGLADRRLLESQKSITTDALGAISPEKMALVDNASLQGAIAMRSAVMSGLSGRRGELLALGFKNRELDDFFARLDPTGASDDSYEAAARKLNVQVSSLRDFVSKVLNTVAEARWEIAESNPASGD